MQDIKSLPSAGGYFEQDWKYIEILNVVRNAYIKEQNKAK